MRRATIVLAVALAVCGCRATVPDGWFACEADGDCPPGQVCGAGVCGSSFDAGRPEDSGPLLPDAGRDAQAEDSGPNGADAGPDAGRGDAGGPSDAGNIDDAGSVDAGGGCEPACVSPAFCSDATSGCECTEPGYESPGPGGTNCIDIDECVVGNDCSTNATCTNTDGSFTCECRCGFSGDGRTCAASSEFWGGPTSVLSGSSSASRDFLVATPFTLTRRARLLSYGAISRSSGATLVLGVYTDDGGSPGTLIVQSRATVLVTGEVVLSPQSPCAMLNAGDYWLASLADADYSLGSDGGSSVGTFFAAFSYSATLPTTFPASPSTFGGPVVNAYIETD